MNKRETGAAGEAAALSVYIDKGYELIRRNWHYKRYGELDLVLYKEISKELYTGTQFESHIIICEVKLRDINSIIKAPSAAVNTCKQNKIRQLTELFLYKNPQYKNCYVRFDVAEVYSQNGIIADINIIENAF